MRGQPWGQAALGPSPAPPRFDLQLTIRLTLYTRYHLATITASLGCPLAQGMEESACVD